MLPQRARRARGRAGRRRAAPVDRAAPARPRRRARAHRRPRPGTSRSSASPCACVAEPGRTRAHRRGGDAARARRATRARRIERWYRRTARAEVAPRLDEAVAALGQRYTRLTIRDQRTRWGSCSTTGAMSFNWRLLLGPADVLDYVVWHEACHLAVMDHSPRFWALLERHRPGYREPQRWLRRNGCDARPARDERPRRRRARRVGRLRRRRPLPGRGRDRHRARVRSAPRPAAARWPRCRWRRLAGARDVRLRARRRRLRAPRARRARPGATGSTVLAAPPRRAPAARASRTSTAAASARSPSWASASCPTATTTLAWDGARRARRRLPHRRRRRRRAPRPRARRCSSPRRARSTTLARGRRRARRARGQRDRRGRGRRPGAPAARRRATSCARAASDGGEWEAADGTRGRLGSPSPPPGAPVDAYGCGDSFAARARPTASAPAMALADALRLAATLRRVRACAGAGPTAIRRPARATRARQRVVGRLAGLRARRAACASARCRPRPTPSPRTSTPPRSPPGPATSPRSATCSTGAYSRESTWRVARRSAPSSRRGERGQRVGRASSKRSRSTVPLRRIVRV